MTWTYNSTAVGSSGLSTVRFHIGDYSSGDQLLTDEAIQAVLSNIVANHMLASAYCADALAANYSRQADTRNEGLDVMASQRAKAFAKLAVDLRRRAGSSATIFVGGRSKQTKDDRRADDDLVQPEFERGADDFPGTIASTTG